MTFVLQTFGIVVGGLFAVAFVKGFVEAMVDDHRRHKKRLEKLERTDPAPPPPGPPRLKVVWPDNLPSQRKRTPKKKRGAKRG